MTIRAGEAEVSRSARVTVRTLEAANIDLGRARVHVSTAVLTAGSDLEGHGVPFKGWATEHGGQSRCSHEPSITIAARMELAM